MEKDKSAVKESESIASSPKDEDKLQQPPLESPSENKIIMVAAIAAGIQFGWALQLSLLTPYVQLLGIPHKWASLIWLCGPISGMLVQPIVGYYSDRCTSGYGRRRPFIAAGVLLVGMAVVLIGYASDMGHAFGDRIDAQVKTRAIIIFATGFWILDVANNMLQGPCRALLADLSFNNNKKMSLANSYFSFFMAVGNVLGYSAGSFQSLHKMFPFTMTEACDVYCANLKTCFFLSIVLLGTLTAIALLNVSEKRWSPEQGIGGREVVVSDGDEPEPELPFFIELLGAFKVMKKPMWMLLVGTCLNWLAWFPFLLFDTDWMGREVYGGDSSSSASQASLQAYNDGVHAGALGLMLNSVVLAFMSLGIEPLSSAVGGVKRLWGIVNMILAVCLGLTVLITKLAEAHRATLPAGPDIPMPPASIKGGALALFAAFGIPLAITFSVPFALASIYSSSSGAGQGLSLGVLNVAIVVPQMVVSVGGGPFDDLFGGGNLPCFVFAAVAAATSALFVQTLE